MAHRWLSFLSIGVLGLIVFIFFWYRNQPIEIPSYEPSVEVGSLENPTVTFVNPRIGAENPRVTIVAFGDFECDACATMATSLKIALKTYPNDVLLVWKNMPNESLHPESTNAAIAAHCADRQGKFWEYHDVLFARQNYLSDQQYSQIAQELTLDEKKFQRCYESSDTLPIVTKDYEEGLALGLTSTPTVYLEDRIIVGAPSTQELLDTIEQILSSN